MPVPFEALLPMGIVAGLFAVTGTGYSLVSRLANEGKPMRHNLDEWERMMMRRDFRLTGSKRGQSREAVAPPEFATNSAWGSEQV
ncbi:hypothetical protein Malapachy_2634 [Malassezia pachydermatis]|uniref:NADH dehydrogenase [ubiquinone] 1 alpha subcomplex subunit 1 n=1 Tax=Malassezia pachydermatis TaxID=77020 RepID=A0A0M8MRW9_9BASI|nr:hypothetical protein Malapachy_2634 [Malassezia pachydermatis]KOS15547.1 hypothetical protein Malapachy_2634 [Malassezia pachydermatis]